jgi:hypothetical protein
MANHETDTIAASAGSAFAEAPGFDIEVHFLGGLTGSQQAAFTDAANRWAEVIVEDLPGIVVDGEAIDDLLILAQGAAIDGSGQTLGQAGPTQFRPDGPVVGASLPAMGVMTFDVADLAAMEAEGTLGDVVAHEMGHVLGIGTLWADAFLLQGAGTANPTFVGPAAMAEYGRLCGTGVATPVPVENAGGPGTQDCHWSEAVFQDELMTGYVGGADNPLSRLTVAGLQDLGYAVDLGAAEPYGLPASAAAMDVAA